MISGKRMEEQLVFCVKCGNKMGDGDIFCGKCGWDSRTGADAADLAEEDGNPQAISAAEQEEESPRVADAAGEDGNLQAMRTAEQEREIPQTADAAGEGGNPQTESVVGQERKISQTADAAGGEDGRPHAISAAEQEREIPQTADAAKEGGDPQAGERRAGRSRKREIPQLEVLPPLPEVTFLEEEDAVESQADAAPPNGNPPAKKRKPRGKIVGIATAFVVLFLVIVGVVLANRNSILNALKKNSSPEEYYRWVEEKAAKDAAGMAAFFYERYFLRGLRCDDICLEAEAGVTLGEAGKTFLALAGVSRTDLSWLEDIGLSMRLSSKDGVMGASAQLRLEEDPIFDFDTLLDTKGEMAYLQFGQLSGAYLGVETGDMEELLEELAMLDRFYDSLPGKGKAEELLLKYVNLALSCVDEVQMAEGDVIRAKGVSQECIKLTVRMDAQTLECMALAVLEGLADDPELRGIILGAAEALEEPGWGSNADADSIYASFQETVAALCRRIRGGRYFDSGTNIRMTVYVDGDGRICGRTIEQEPYGTKLSFLLPRDGDAFGLELSSENRYGEAFALTGKGSVAGTSYSGAFSVASYGTESFAFEAKEVDVGKWKRGLANGTFCFPLGYDVLGGLGLYGMEPYLKDLVLTVGISGSADSIKLTCGLGAEREEWGTLAVGIKLSSGERGSIPSGKDVIKIEKKSDVEDYLETVDLDAYAKRLSGTALPTEVAEFVKDIAEAGTERLCEFLWRMISYGFLGVPENMLF